MAARRWRRLQKLPAGVETKNTFLDCKSPWIEPLSLDKRPNSDPTSSLTCSDLGLSSAAVPSDAEATRSAPNEEELSPRHQGVAWARERPKTHHAAASSEFSDGVEDTIAPKEQDPAPSRTQRRRLQRNLLRQQYATALTSSGGTW
ncbi:unnamed protein product [Prorocentrum cordatum]|uniref:Uncharacterized protein n=1 Tax=Prorocentrum cordatum TaxID=2364126 RepID=A0ABN9QEC5_9DINO|nr:unnamed protein product [Polarella glacialis]|mmetsp:Transcript_69031/g.179861  ORF Transcript_69031/g.179861 Transcript_69031/m.179861 type:complete len:146 (+) Transcript_69031:99-536(+)